MKIVANECTIVVIGSWNLAILNPEWLAVNIFRETEVDVEFLIGGARPQIRVAKGGVSITPSERRVVFAAATAEDGELGRMSALAASMLKALPVTPISSFGVNFGFREDAPPPRLLEVFQLADRDKIADAELTPVEWNITRAFDVQNARLNMRLRYNGGDDVKLHFNYHNNVANTASAADILDRGILELRRHSLALTNSLYGLDLDEDDDA